MIGDLRSGIPPSSREIKWGWAVGGRFHKSQESFARSGSRRSSLPLDFVPGPLGAPRYYRRNDGGRLDVTVSPGTRGWHGDRGPRTMPYEPRSPISEN